MNMKDKAAIVGVGYTPQGRIPGRSAMSFHVEAAKNAIADAGLRRDEVDGLICASWPPSSAVGLAPTDIAQRLGLRIRFGSEATSFGVLGGDAAHLAAWAVVHGMADYVVCTYGENPHYAAFNPYRQTLGDGQLEGDEAAFGYFGAPSAYALAARRGMHEFGTGPETWGEIAVAIRKWANLNPRAVMCKKTLTLDDYMNSRFVVEPLRLYDICQVTDSGRAFLVTTAERARDCKRPPVYIMGMGQDHPGVGIGQAKYLAGSTGAKKSGKQAFKMAEITLKDIDACEIYDCFTYTVEVTLMDYGFFEPGEGKDFLKAGRLGPGGDFPINTSGGLLSEVYQQGFTPLTEAVVQLRGEAGDRQLDDPKIILVSGNGGTLSSHATTILRR